MKVSAELVVWNAIELSMSVETEAPRMRLVQVRVRPGNEATQNRSVAREKRNKPMNEADPGKLPKTITVITCPNNARIVSQNAAGRKVLPIGGSGKRAFPKLSREVRSAPSAYL